MGGVETKGSAVAQRLGPSPVEKEEKPLTVTPGNEKWSLVDKLK